MADNGIGNLNPMITQGLKDITQAAKAAPQTQKPATAEGGVIQDKIEISKQAKAISKAMVYLNQLQDIRTDLVDKAINNRITEAQRTPANVLAAKLLLED